MEEEIPEGEDDDDYEEDFEAPNKAPTPKVVKQPEPPKPALPSYGKKPVFGSKPNIFASKKGSGGNPTPFGAANSAATGTAAPTNPAPA
jgi:hypothetical protein